MFRKWIPLRDIYRKTLVFFVFIILVLGIFVYEFVPYKKNFYKSHFIPLRRKRNRTGEVGKILQNIIVSYKPYNDPVHSKNKTKCYCNQNAFNI